MRDEPPKLAQIIVGLKEYQKLYGDLLRAKPPKRDRRILKKKHARFKKAVELLKPILGL